MNLSKIKFFVLALMASAVLVACNDDDDNPTASNNSSNNGGSNTDTLTTVSLNFNGLEDLGSDYVYEGWVITSSGTPVSTGTFTVNSEGVLSQTDFTVDSDTLAVATRFVLSIEPAQDPDPAPAATKLFAGNISNNMATLDHGAVASSGFASVAGTYILATPSTATQEDENSGVWFISGGRGSLTLPTLAEGWRYEGWAVIDGTPVSTGYFTDPNMSDTDIVSYDNNTGDPGTPGEDFILNAPMGLTFPTNLAGDKIVISVEPVPDNSPAPFTLKPLAGDVPTDATDHFSYSLSNNVADSYPTGTVTLR